MASTDFNRDLWTPICRYDAPPAGQVICCIDPQFSSGSRHDETGLAASVIYETEGETHAMRLLDAVGIRRKGADLGNGIVDFLEQHKPVATFIEGIPAAEILRDVIIWKAEVRGLEIGAVIVKAVDRTKGAKAIRIGRLNGIVTEEKPRFFVQEGDYLEKLFEQLGDFNIEARRNCKPDDVIDAVAMLLKYLPL